MKAKTLGKNGPVVSTVGFGCMGMSDFYGSPQTRDDAESIRTIQAALDHGINFLNTGDFYGMGHNESLIAKAIRGRRDQAFISVKFGAQRAPDGTFLGFDGSPAAVKTFCSYSLQRLGVEAIDLYQPARVDAKVPYEDTIGAIADLIKEGKVRYLGISEANADQIRRAHKTHPVTALEIEYALATRFIEKSILPTVRELGIGVVAYGVVSRGLLTGAFGENHGATDYRAILPRFQGENLTHNLKKVQVLQSMAQSKGCTPAQLAIAWVLSRGDDIVPLIATSKTSRLKENLRALEIKITPDEQALLEQTFPEGAIHGTRYNSHGMASVAG